jgi:2-keto-3-deoxy-6-phosphogluconate aldolase
MGEVYKARDARLDRAVGAGKVLSAIEERQASLVGGELIRPPRERGEELVSHER